MVILLAQATRAPPRPPLVNRLGVQIVAFHRNVFGVLLIAIQFMPILVGFIASLIEWDEADKTADEPAADEIDRAMDTDSELESPTSPFSDDAPPQEETKSDEEQPTTFRDEEALPC